MRQRSSVAVPRGVRDREIGLLTSTRRIDADLHSSTELVCYDNVN
jgi:hypothetical protein